DTGGSGLGLAIVAAIVGSHGGSVRVEKTDGGGATFVVSLPQRDDVPDPGAHVGESRMEADRVEENKGDGEVMHI
ncbi:MAG TPA: ATP-binding protein, partial [Arthrobacter sp.]